MVIKNKDTVVVIFDEIDFERVRLYLSSIQFNAKCVRKICKDFNNKDVPNKAALNELRENAIDKVICHCDKIMDLVEKDV